MKAADETVRSANQARGSQNENVNDFRCSTSVPHFYMQP